MDYTRVDGAEAVTFVSVAARATSKAGVLTSTNTSKALSNALRGAATVRDVAKFSGRVRADDEVFMLAATELGATVPKPGDHITDATARKYLLVLVEPVTLTRWFRCWARRMT